LEVRKKRNPDEQKTPALIGDGKRGREHQKKTFEPKKKRET